MKQLGETILTVLVCGGLGAALGVGFGAFGDWLTRRAQNFFCSHDWHWTHGGGWSHRVCRNCGAEEWVA